MDVHELQRWGRNSHIPACVECRERKAKCSKTQPCAPCVRNNRKCVYTSKVSRTPLTRKHLTAVETRLHALEDALERLFPSGSMQDMTRDLLLMDSSFEQIATEIPTESSKYQGLSTDRSQGTGSFADGFLPTNQSSAPSAVDLLSMNIDDLSQSSAEVYTPPATIHEESMFIDAYFTHYHTVYPLLHEKTFRSVRVSQQFPTHWPVLVNAVLALGSWLTSGTSLDVEKAYFARAEELLGKSPIGTNESSSLTLVQGLVLLSSLAQHQGQPEKSIQYTSSAVQMSVSLNLHMEPQDAQSTELDKEVRRRIWWSVYCAESCSAKIYGRPLLLPEDALITTRPVSNFRENDLTSSSTYFPQESDQITIYMGLIQQSSYHRLANRIYRHLLSCPNFGSKQVQEVEEMIDKWHKTSSSCLHNVNPSSSPEWYVTARRRQIMCDRSLRLLIHRPLLLRWLRIRAINGGPFPSNDPAEVQCRAKGLKIARETIEMISTSFVRGQYSKLTVTFTLYSLFHALIVPLIHIMVDPSTPSSISCMEDVNKANSALQNLPLELDPLSQSFLVAIKQLVNVSERALKGYQDISAPSETKQTLKPNDVRPSDNNIFGNEELKILKNQEARVAQQFDFSQWLNL